MHACVQVTAAHPRLYCFASSSSSVYWNNGMCDLCVTLKKSATVLRKWLPPSPWLHWWLFFCRHLVVYIVLSPCLTVNPRQNRFLETTPFVQITMSCCLVLASTSICFSVLVLPDKFLQQCVLGFVKAGSRSRDRARVGIFPAPGLLGLTALLSASITCFFPLYTPFLH